MCDFGEGWARMRSARAAHPHGLNSKSLWVMASCVQSARHFGSAVTQWQNEQMLKRQFTGSNFSVLHQTNNPAHMACPSVLQYAPFSSLWRSRGISVFSRFFCIIVTQQFVYFSNLTHSVGVYTCTVTKTHLELHSFRQLSLHHRATTEYSATQDLFLTLWL